MATTEQKSSSTAATTTSSSKQPKDNVKDSYLGRFKLATSENFDGFLREIGIGMIKRKLANASYPVLDITRDENNNITITTSAPFTRATTTFKLNEEFDEQRLDGKVVKSTVEQQGNKFIQTQTDGSLVIKYIREFAGDEIRVTSIANDVSCFRVYKRMA